MKYFTANIYNGLIQGHVLQLCIWSTISRARSANSQSVKDNDNEQWPQSSLPLHVPWISSVESGELHHKESSGKLCFVVYSQTTVTLSSDCLNLSESFGELLENTEISGPTLDSKTILQRLRPQESVFRKLQRVTQMNNQVWEPLMYFKILVSKP